LKGIIKKLKYDAIPVTLEKINKFYKKVSIEKNLFLKMKERSSEKCFIRAEHGRSNSTCDRLSNPEYLKITQGGRKQHIILDIDPSNEDLSHIKQKEDSIKPMVDCSTQLNCI
jgi:hypothetical protein